MSKFKIGDLRYGHEVLPAEKRKTLLFLSDDLRMTSGIATMTKELILGTCHRFNYIHIGAAIEHPDKGKQIDLSSDITNLTGVPDVNVKLLPWSGYGDAGLVRDLILRYNPTGIVHFTDPRYWRWLYAIEHEIRQTCPLIYYTIWDNVGTPPYYEGDPLYNKNYYESCDSLLCISKQTYGMIKRIGDIKSVTYDGLKDWQVQYVPHGINYDIYKPVDVPSDFRKKILGEKDYKFVLFWMNRNIKRKQPSDVIWAFKKFVDRIPTEDRDKVCLLMHTQPVDENGTDLYKVAERLAPGCDVKFSTDRLNQDQLNYLFNLSDCTINIAGNEGFGLTTVESVMAGTPIIVAVTGGLQDQCGFKGSAEYLTENDYIKIGSLHNYKLWKDVVSHGEWAIPVWPKAQTMIGSVPTPYIIDDKVDIDDTADAILSMYNISKEERKKRGLVGRNEFINKIGLGYNTMNEKFISGVNTLLNNWKPKDSYKIYKVK